MSVATDIAVAARWDGKPPTSAEEILRRIENIAPLIRDHADAMEELGHFTPEVKQALSETGVYSMGFPREWGGPEVRIDDQIRILEALARLDGSVGFAVNIMADSGLYAGRLDRWVAQEIYPSMEMSTAGSFNPPGKAEVVDGGYRLSGRWRFGTGNIDADVILGRFRRHVDDVPQVDENGDPDLIVAWFPNKGIIRHQNWHTTGMSATGSCDYEISGVEIPASHSYRYADQFYASPDVPPLSRHYGTLTGNQVGVVLGVTRHALDLLYTHLDKAKTKWGSQVKASSYIQIKTAKIDAQYQAARAYALSTFGGITDSLLAGEELTTQQLADMQSAPVLAAELCLEAVNAVLDLVGATATLKSLPYDRVWRDLSAAIRHFYYREVHLELPGKHLLGIPVDMSQSD
ncbi:acyl-CoA dehydrogenase family protein [Nocardia sp. NPDC052112]|uniref:acyl-CoA dehydrogenase family protein n=1 Tax=Nocardia sp. NPDC052112 TaxID=3155646 RepID=UPI00341DFE8E